MLFKLFGTMNSWVNESSLKLSEGEIEIGLILSKQIIEHFGGIIDFTSEYESGTRFIFSFPLESVDESYDKALEESPSTRPESPSFGGGGGRA